jgi:DNA ligase-associated metallophosphoesterase
MNAAPLHLGAERMMLDPAGVLHWPAQKLLCVADLHLEKGSAFARAGYFLPPYDTRETLARLALLIRRYGPKRLVFLGDSFHDAEGAARLSPADRAALLRLLEGLEPIWVLGNHDPAPPCDLPGAAFAEWRQGPITFRHIPSPFSRQAPPEIAGHFHPKATAPTRAGGISRPCFVANPRRVIMPAFGAFTGGLCVTDPAIARLFPQGGRAFLLGEERLYSFPLAARTLPIHMRSPEAS